MADSFMNMLSAEDRQRTLRLHTLTELETLCRERYAELTAVVTPDDSVSYTRLWDEVARIRGGLIEAGMTRGEIVGVCMPNNLDAIETFLAVITGGGVAAMLPGAMSGEALVGPCRLLGLRLLVTHHAEAPLPVLEPAALRAHEPVPAADVKPEDPAAAFFTGGTSGKPKSALLNHCALMAGAYNGIFTPTPAYFQRYYALIPFAHVFGTIRNMLTCFQTGSALRTCTDMMRLVADLQQFKPTILVLVPALCEMLLGIAKAHGLGAIGGCLHTIIAGAAPVPDYIIPAFAQLGVTVCPGYGLTESANLVSGNGEAATHPNSVGRVYNTMEIRFVDGEIQLRGDNIFSGYVNDPEETRDAFTDGWFRTGDLGYLDDEGYLYITGRIKNLLVLPNGEKLCPEEIERLVDNLPEVRGNMVSMTPNEFGAEVLTCEVFAGDADRDATRERILAINRTLPAATQIQKVIFRDTDFKRSGSMKIVRNQK